MCFVFHTHGIVCAACVTCHAHFWLWGCVWQTWPLFISFCYEFVVYLEHVCVCVLKVCAAQLVVLLWVRLRSMWSRCELFATGVTCFVLASWFVVPPVLSCSVCLEVWLVSFLFWLLTSSVFFHNGVWLWVMLYNVPRRSPG